MSCNCNNRRNTDAIVPQGNTFSVLFQYKENGTAQEMPAGYDMIVGMYDTRGNLLKEASYSDGSITYGEGRYSLAVSHDESMGMVGMVTLELTIVDDNENAVEHASEAVTLYFEPRNNNRLL